MDKTAKNTVETINVEAENVEVTNNEALPEGFTSMDAQEEESSTQLMAYHSDDLAGVGLIEALKNPQSAFYCSIKDDGSRASKIAIYNGLKSKCEQLLDFRDKVITVTDVAAHPITVVDEKTGEIKTVLRTILIGADGTNYQAVSEGVVSSLQAIYAIVGAPSWKDEPVNMLIKEEKTKKGFKVTSITLVV